MVQNPDTLPQTSFKNLPILTAAMVAGPPKSHNTNRCSTGPKNDYFMRQRGQAAGEPCLKRLWEGGSDGGQLKSRENPAGVASADPKGYVIPEKGNSCAHTVACHI